MEQELYVFWKYDDFPYCLGGELLLIDNDGLAHVEGYNGYRFKPLAILTLEKGKELHREIKACAAAYQKERNDVYAKHMSILKSLVEW